MGHCLLHRYPFFSDARGVNETYKAAGVTFEASLTGPSADATTLEAMVAKLAKVSKKLS